MIYRSEPAFMVPTDELPTDIHTVAKPARKNRTLSSKSDPPTGHPDSFEEPSKIEKHSPNNSRYTIDIKDING